MIRIFSRWTSIIFKELFGIIIIFGNKNIKMVCYCFFFNEKNKTNYYQKFLKHFIFWEFLKIVGFYIFERKKYLLF